MKNHSLSIPAAITGLLLLFPSVLYAQPGFRSDVQKEYDENGNITRYDSCWSWSYSGGPFVDPDSLFTRFFRDHPWTFDSGHDHFPSFEYGDPDFDHFFSFPDSMHLIVPRFGLPDHSWEHHSPFDEPFLHGDLFEDFFEDTPFPDIEELFNEHLEKMRHYYHSHPFPDDSLRYHHPEWQSLPGEQKKSERTIDI